MTDVVETYAEALSSFRALAASLRPDDWARPTECPGWNVHDQVGHVVALELELAGQPLAAALRAYGPHVRNPVGERMENGVDALRALDPAALLARLGSASEAHVKQLHNPGLDLTAPVLGPRNVLMPLGDLLPLRVFDVWTHEQDVRRAVSRPGGFGCAAAQVAVDRVVSSLPYVVGKVLAAPTGTSVSINAAGDLPVAVTVTVGADRRATLAQRAPAAPGVTGEATVLLRTTTETLLRLACGRIDPATAPVELTGDKELGRRLLSVMAITP